jgi:hypothetical protein
MAEFTPYAYRKLVSGAIVVAAVLLIVGMNTYYGSPIACLLEEDWSKLDEKVI